MNDRIKITRRGILDYLVTELVEKYDKYGTPASVN